MTSPLFLKLGEGRSCVNCQSRFQNTCVMSTTGCDTVSVTSDTPLIFAIYGRTRISFYVVNEHWGEFFSHASNRLSVVWWFETILCSQIMQWPNDTIQFFSPTCHFVSHAWCILSLVKGLPEKFQQRLREYVPLVIGDYVCEAVGCTCTYIATDKWCNGGLRSLNL